MVMFTQWGSLGLRDLDTTFAVLNEFRREMNRAFRDADRGTLGQSPGQTGGPHVELVDTGAALVVRAQVPGFDEKDITITMEQRSLAMKGERKDEAPEEYAVHRKERGAFTFSRAFSLPCQVDTEKTTAVVRNGILELTLLKSPESQPRRIEIQAN
jgi:HSP20 family protein